MVLKFLLIGIPTDIWFVQLFIDGVNLTEHVHFNDEYDTKHF